MNLQCGGSDSTVRRDAKIAASRAAQALARLALQNIEVSDVVIAVASSASRRPMELFESLLAAERDLSKLEGLMRNLVTLVIPAALSRTATLTTSPEPGTVTNTPAC